MDNLKDHYIKAVIEALLFINEKPVASEQIREVLKTVSPAEIKNVVQELKQEYEQNQRGMVIAEIAGGYQMLSNPHYASYIRSFFKTRVKEKLSRPALEVLAITAYKQPVTRTDIELIRGVNSDGVVVTLLEKGLIKAVGRKDVPGRPYLYGTTKMFLEYFGLKSLDDLPKLEKFSDLQRAEEVVPLHRVIDETLLTPGGDNHPELEENKSVEPDAQSEKNSDASSVEDESTLMEEPLELKEAMDQMNKQMHPALDETEDIAGQEEAVRDEETVS